MRIEHIGYMVEKPDELVRWYVENLGFTVKRKIGGESGTHFLADSTGQVIIEIYNNPTVDLPDYRSMNPLSIWTKVI